MTEFLNSYESCCLSNYPLYNFTEDLLHDFILDPDFYEETDPTIQSDVAKYNGNEKDNLNSDSSSGLLTNYEPVNRDCMWPGNGSQLSSSVGSNFSDVATHFPLATVTGNTQNIINNITIKQEETEPVTIVANAATQSSKSFNHQQQQVKQIQSQPANKFGFIKIEPQNDDYELVGSVVNSSSNSSNGFIAIATRQPLQLQSNSMQNIPPGTSLLKTRNILQTKKPKTYDNKATSGTLVLTNGVQTIQTPKIETSEFIRDHRERDRDQLLSSTTSTLYTKLSSNTTNLNSSSNTTSTSYGRPDTPPCMDDDGTCMSFSGVSSFSRHNVDLGACVRGSNNIDLLADPHTFIQQISKELQDTDKKEIDSLLIKSKGELADVLDLINNENSIGGKNGSFHLYEDSMAGSSSASSLLDSSDSIYKTSPQSPTSSPSSLSPIHSSSSSNAPHHHHNLYKNYLHSDHSYTRYNDGIDDTRPSIETPSDSDEEIDVVSINDKKLPTNPSDKDRRALQSKVKDRLSYNGRDGKSSTSRTLQARRSMSYEFPYTPASNSPEKSNSCYSSPASTPYHRQHSQTSTSTKYIQRDPHISSSAVYVGKSLKRLLQNSSCSSLNGTYINDVIEYGQVATPLPNNTTTSSSSSSSPAVKRPRGKKSKHSSSQSSQYASSVCSSNGSKKQYSLDETNETIEKRNLHNDMERQRRIGLKNLFESLKKQIPSIRDKERAPKVNILREAAKLCEALTQESDQLNNEKFILKEELRRKRARIASLHSMQAIEID